MCYNQIWQNFGGDEYSCKLDKEYLNAVLSKFVVYSSQHSETFNVSRLSIANHHRVISTQTGPVFFSPPCTFTAVLSSVNRNSNLPAKKTC